MAFTSFRFRNNRRLEKAAKNNPAMRKPEQGYAVRLIQQSLIDLGYRLPISTKKYASPDGMYGNETRSAVIKFQKDNTLGQDGVVGKNSMATFDRLLPNATPRLPPIGSQVSYRIPGTIVVYDQLKPVRKTMGCWAFSYAMMRSWKDQVSRPITDIMDEVGPVYRRRYDNNSVLSWSLYPDFFQKAGLRGEPMACYPVQTWVSMLKSYGPLLIGAPNLPGGVGGHVRLLIGVSGDGNEDSTRMHILDPWGGRRYTEALHYFNELYEGGAFQNRLVQIGHF